MKKQADAVFRTINVSKPSKEKYPQNIIRNQKYRWYTFPFFVIMNQFKHFFNIYFFFISFSQLIKTYRVGPPICNILPWLFVLFLTLGKEAVDDIQRYIRDKEVNAEKYKKITTNGIVIVPSSTLQVGDLVILEKNQRVPADMVVLKTQECGGQCFIRTDQLDGETDWKLRNAVASTQAQDVLHLFRKSKELTILSVERTINNNQNVTNVEEPFMSDSEAEDANEFSNKETINHEYDDALDNVLDGDDKKTFEKMQENENIEIDPIANDNAENMHAKSDTANIKNTLDTLSPSAPDNSQNDKVEEPISTVIRIETLRTTEQSQIDADTSELFNKNITIYADKPHKDIYKFIGRLVMEKNGETIAEPLDLQNVVWMNTILATQGIIGCVIYTGQETRAMMNTLKPRNKFGKIEEEINYYSILLCISSVLVACVFMFFSGISARFDINLIRFIIIFSSVIPISLKVTIDVARMFFYANWIMNDPDIPGCIVRNSNIPEELGRITYLLSDKTGTLTRNEMEMRKVHVGPICYTTELNSEITEILRKKRAKKHGKSRDLGSKVFELVRALSLCHNVTPVEEEGVRSYQASSPDEIAIVRWCEAVGIVLKQRTKNGIEISILDETAKMYKILYIFPFTSDTKRMGIIVRDVETMEILFFLKGADMVMRKIVEKNDWLDEEVDNMAREGLRTLVIGMKKLKKEEFAEFEKEYNEASLAIINRSEETQKVVCKLENNLKLLGLTGVEDKLQENVNQSLENLRNAGVKIWMLTGDKIETAISISISSRLFLKRSLYEILRVSSREDAWQQLRMLKEKTINYIIIDGSSLQIMIDNFMKEFIEFAAGLDAVVCCRCTPTQKALIARNLRMLTSHRVACIGDGGNDVSMITEANVGIGIVGKEGNQASLAADFSILKFSDVTTLFFWHGRNCYKGTAKLIQFIIHRGTIISVMQGIFSAVFLFSPIALYQGIIMVGYVCVYTMCPMWCIILDRDVSKQNCFKYPELYKEMVRIKILSSRSFAGWNLISFYQGSVIMIATFYQFKHELLSIISITFSCLVINELLVVLLMVSRINKWMVISQMVSLMTYVLSFLLFRDELRLPDNLPKFFLNLILISALAIAFSIIEVLYYKYLRPPSYSKIQQSDD